MSKKGWFLSHPFFLLRVLLFLSIALSFSGISFAAGTNTLTVTATVVSDNDCRFRSNSALNFGNLDPANPVDRTVTTSITFRCRGRDRDVTFFISDDDGLYETGPDANRMKHATLNEYLPYSFTLNPTSGTIPRRTDQTLNITGTVLGADYQNASMGSYSDIVTITIVP